MFYNVDLSKLYSCDDLTLYMFLGGTMFGTTPGGSKIVYDRLYLLKVRDSPASHVSHIHSIVFTLKSSFGCLRLFVEN